MQEPTWYRRAAVGDLGQLQCPRCRTHWIFGPIFDHDPRWCPHCKAELREWNMNGGIYLIDAERAPRLVQALLAHLKTLDEPTAFHQLDELLRFLGADGMTG